MNRIAECESRNHAHAKNPTSSASGRFQFIKGSWEYYGDQLWGTTTDKNIFVYRDNTDLAYFVAKKYGFSPWESSAFCWR